MINLIRSYWQIDLKINAISSQTERAGPFANHFSYGRQHCLSDKILEV